MATNFRIKIVLALAFHAEWNIAILISKHSMAMIWLATSFTNLMTPGFKRLKGVYISSFYIF